MSHSIGRLGALCVAIAAIHTGCGATVRSADELANMSGRNADEVASRLGRAASKSGDDADDLGKRLINLQSKAPQVESEFDRLVMELIIIDGATRVL